MSTALNTLPELVAAIAAAMAGWPDPDNGQVRATPDERTLRWYGTIGLMDRPLSWRGRTALYGERHRLQVLAVKRLQLAGWAIAAIQERLIAADDGDLAAVAAGEAGAPRSEPPPEPTAPRRNAPFWATPAEPVIPAVTRQHVDLGRGAELVLPAGIASTAGLEAALAPLRAWLASTSPAAPTASTTGTEERNP